VAEITKRRMGELVRGVFSILLEHPEGVAASEVLAELEKRVPPTQFENSFYPNSPNVRRYGKIVRFSTIGPVKAGWLVKEKGHWTLTDEGRAAYETYRDPEELFDRARKLYYEWKKGQPEDVDDVPDDGDGAAPSTTLEEAEEAAWADIRAYLAAMPPYEFQELVAALLRAMGYRVDWVAPPGQDQGIDIVAYTDTLGAVGPRIKVQVKRRPDNKTSADDLRAFLAVLHEQDIGLYVCTGGFTSSAEREARGQEKRRITLVDDSRLLDLWIQHYETLSDEDRLRLPLTPVYFLQTTT
jgi:restriction system protein